MRKAIFLLFVAALMCGCSQKQSLKQENLTDTTRVTAKGPMFGVRIGDDIDETDAKLTKIFDKLKFLSEHTLYYFHVAYNGVNYRTVVVTPEIRNDKKRVRSIAYLYDCEDEAEYLDVIEMQKKKYGITKDVDTKSNFFAVKFFEDSTKVAITGESYYSTRVAETSYSVYVEISSVSNLKLE